jgi:hypothetical protein
VVAAAAVDICQEVAELADMLLVHLCQCLQELVTRSQLVLEAQLVLVKTFKVLTVVIQYLDLLPQPLVVVGVDRMAPAQHITV